MSDLISRKYTISALSILASKMSDAGATVMEQAISVVQDMSSEEPEERTANVIEHDVSITDTDGYRYQRTEYLCEACKKRVVDGDEYCSHCGAKLIWSGSSAWQIRNEGRIFGWQNENAG